MRGIGRLALVAATVAIWLGLGSASASAHALMQTADPAPGSTVGASPAAVTVTFGERPDPRLSSIKVLGTDGQNHASGAAQAVPGNPLQLRVAVTPLPDGVYTVSWRTLSAVDGHSAAGSFAFGVGVPVGAGAATTSQAASGTDLASASLLGALARYLLYVGLIAMFGAGIVGRFIAPTRADSTVRLAVAGFLLATAGTLGVIGVQWANAQADLGQILGTSLGLMAVVRLATIVLAAAATAWLLGSASGSRRLPLAGVLATSGAAMAVDVLSGHAGGVEPAWLQEVLQWLHVAAAGFWIGGLAALLLALRGASPEERGPAARRFSLVAGFAIAIVAVTGAIRAVFEIGTIDALLSTDYGRLVIAKSALIVVLAGLGATNHFWSVPAAGRTFTRLRRVGTTELSVAIVALALTAALVDLAPPISVGAAAAAGPQPIVALGNDFGTSVRVRLVVTPGMAGGNDFQAAVTDYDSHQPIDASALSLRFQIASASGVGGSSLSLNQTGTGDFEASGPNLSLDGIWAITATVTSPSGSVEVPLDVATIVPAQPVDSNVTPGLPTIDTVHLADGRSVQVYLDPMTAGADELHATFFDATGTELPVATASMLVVPASGVGSIPNLRQLEPGHFVADVQVDAGPLVVDVVGPDPKTGTPIHIHLAITVQP